MKLHLQQAEGMPEDSETYCIERSFLHLRSLCFCDFTANNPGQACRGRYFNLGSKERPERARANLALVVPPFELFRQDERSTNVTGPCAEARPGGRLFAVN